MKYLKKLPFIKLITAIVFLIVTCIIKDIPAESTFKYINHKIVSHSWHNTYDNIIAAVFLIYLVSFIILIIYRIIRKIKNQTLQIIVCEIFSLAALFISSCTISYEYDYNPQYFEFTDGQHIIVIEEESYLLYGGGTVFQIKNDNQAVMLGKFTTDDGGRNNGKYDIRWYDKYAEITYNYFDTKNSKRTIKVEFE